MHIRVGESALGREVDRWLARGNATIDACNDPYETVAHLLLQNHQMPDLAIMSAEALLGFGPEVLGCVRETWPGSPVVVYGPGAEFGGGPGQELVRFVESPDALLEYFTQRPDQVAERIRSNLASSASVIPTAETGEFGDRTAGPTEVDWGYTSPTGLSKPLEHAETAPPSPAVESVRVDRIRATEPDQSPEPDWNRRDDRFVVEPERPSGPAFTADDLAVILGARRRPPRQQN